MTTRHFHIALLLGTLTLSACEFDLANPNSPDPIGPNPTPERVAAAATGLLLGSRAGFSAFVLNTGIIGREAYRFDGSEPRYTSEILTGQLDAGGFIGASNWALPYSNIRTANELIAVVPTASALSAAQQSAVLGFAHTMQALDFLQIVNTHTQDSIPLDVGTDPTAPPAPLATRTAALNRIEALLDQAQTELQAGGSSFPFSLSSGFTGLETPATFLRFNRALRARVAIYRGNYAEALTHLAGSFVDTLQSLDLGAYHTYSTGAGDVTNPLAQNPQTGENFAHPQLRDSAQLQPGGQPDRRFLNKTVQRQSQTTSGLTSDLGWIRYPNPGAFIPIIRNEDLILLRAEANIQTNNLLAALDDINFVRVNSGGLAPLLPFASQAAAINALLYERRYSLLYEGGHRWLDMRRYNRLDQLPIDRAGDLVYSTFPIPTDEVLARQ